MYQASDGKWYPVSSMPSGYQAGGGGGYGGHPGGMQYGQQPQPIYVQQGHSSGMGGGGAAAGTGCLGECSRGQGGAWARPLVR